MEHFTNCPNCGAVLNGHQCSYCGTVTVNLTDITPNSGDRLYIKVGDFVLKGICTKLDLTMCINELNTLDAEFVVEEIVKHV